VDATRPFSAPAQLYGVVHNGTMWLVVSTNSTVLTSTDASHWDCCIQFTGGSANAGSRSARACSSPWANSGVIRTVPDGLTGRRAPPTRRTRERCLLRHGLFWSPPASNGKIVTSPDGITWTVATVARQHALQGAYGASRFVVGGGGTLVTSADVRRGLPPVFRYQVRVFGGGQFCRAGWPAVSLLPRMLPPLPRGPDEAQVRQ